MVAGCVAGKLQRASPNPEVDKPSRMTTLPTGQKMRCLFWKRPFFGGRAAMERFSEQLPRAHWIGPEL